MALLHSVGHRLKSQGLLGNASLMPAMTKIVEIAFSMPVSNVWPEHGASLVKRIKTQLRGSLENRMLNALMHNKHPS